MEKVGIFHGINIYESERMGIGRRSAAIALPGYGIIVGKGVYSQQQDMATVYHEYGHFLQTELIGKVRFYLQVGLPSLMSAWLNWHGHGHQHYWTELWCNHLVKSRFPNIHWPDRRFPCKDISPKAIFWLGLRKRYNTTS